MSVVRSVTLKLKTMKEDQGLSSTHLKKDKHNDMLETLFTSLEKVNFGAPIVVE